MMRLPCRQPCSTLLLVLSPERAPAQSESEAETLVNQCQGIEGLEQGFQAVIGPLNRRGLAAEARILSGGADIERPGRRPG